MQNNIYNICIVCFVVCFYVFVYMGQVPEIKLMMMMMIIRKPFSQTEHAVDPTFR